jgi:peptide/nickel transport system substrate-binding protein
MSELNKLRQLFQLKKITRREFLEKSSALGIYAALCTLPIATRSYGASPRKGGRFRYALTGGGTTDSLDPATIADHMMINVNWQVRNNLVEIDHKGNPIPELAESWEPSKDVSKWIFNLRKGVEFHNGKTMDAEDVVFSIEHHRKKDSKSGAKGLLSSILEIKTDGKNRVIFTLDGGDADLPFILSDYHLTIQPSGTTDFENGMGTGGYILERFEPGVACLARRNPNYWKSGRAHFDEVETLSISDDVARTTALKTKSIDFMNRCDLKTLSLLQKVPYLQIVTTTGTKHYTIPMLTDVAPYDNNDVRLALKYAIDRELHVKQIFRGLAKPGNDHPISPSQKYYASELPQRQYDPDKALYHLKKAGLQGHTFKLHTADVAGSIAVDSAMLYKESAAKAGINIEIVREPNDGYWSNVWMKKSWCYSHWSGRPTPGWMFATTYIADSKWNESHWKNERFNALYKSARSELDDNKRREMYVEMQGLVRDEGGTVIYAFSSDPHAASIKLKFDTPASNMECDGARVAERWWFSS